MRNGIPAPSRTAMAKIGRYRIQANAMINSDAEAERVRETTKALKDASSAIMGIQLTACMYDYALSISSLIL